MNVLNMSKIRLLDLFSGIGGFSLGAKWEFGDDLEIVGFCEKEEYCQKVLKKNFPNVPIHKDIEKLNTNQFKKIDIITGGFPCQDISVAGKGKGIIDGKRSSLWFEMLRCISDIRPKFAVIENVPALTKRGGVEVIRSLAESGYDAEWQIISAKQVGARHLRKRIWIVAYRSSKESETVSNSDSIRLKRQRKHEQPINQEKNKIRETSKFINVCFRDIWQSEPKLGRVANGIPNRVHRIRGLGNAIVPQNAQVIFRLLKPLLYGGKNVI